MADKFYVGQKVRFVLTKFTNVKYIHLAGSITTIANQSGWDGYYQTTTIDNGEAIQANEEDLEPIYDGEEKSNWSECAWKPNTVKHD